MTKRLTLFLHVAAILAQCVPSIYQLFMCTVSYQMGKTNMDMPANNNHLCILGAQCGDSLCASFGLLFELECACTFRDKVNQ
jgi:hypothetical protein